MLYRDFQAAFRFAKNAVCSPSSKIQPPSSKRNANPASPLLAFVLDHGGSIFISNASPNRQLPPNQYATTLRRASTTRSKTLSRTGLPSFAAIFRLTEIIEVNGVCNLSPLTQYCCFEDEWKAKPIAH
jgi:hypothetical protein